MHWLHRLLAPGSIAIVGASEKTGSIGNNTLRLLLDTSYPGDIYPVNPNRDAINGIKCYPDLYQLPSVPDLVVFAVNGRVLEQGFEQAIQQGVGGAVIYANSYISEDSEPCLLERLKHKAKQANIPVCGGNGMGFQNYAARTIVSFDTPPERPMGHVTYIAHSGSAMTYLANNDPRFTYNLVVSSGQEINASFVDYMDYALEQEHTKVIALFIETVRDPVGFTAALEKAERKQIPVVVVKVGRTEQSARFAATHSGAIAGNDQAFQAVCDRYGVIRVRDLDELAETAYLFAHLDSLSAGWLASITDSGGLREQLIDLASEIGLPFAQLSDTTKKKLSGFLEYGLEADNPLDAMGALNADVKTTYGNCLDAMAEDNDVALLTLEFEFRDDFCHYPSLLEAANDYQKNNNKPLLLISSTITANNRRTAVDLSRRGIPVINGADLALKSIRNVLKHRDYIQPQYMTPLTAEKSSVQYWQSRINQCTMSEDATLAMLMDFHMPVIRHRVCTTCQETLEAARYIGFPVALKTGENIAHKTEANGVHLNLDNEDDLIKVYADIERRLGSKVLVARMAQPGIEIGLGMVNDPQFGPVVMLAAGGMQVELLDDRAFALTPFDVSYAKHLIQNLRISRLLENPRGQPYDIESLANLISRFSILMDGFSDHIVEMDINPVIVHLEGCTIVDALLIPKNSP